MTSTPGFLRMSLLIVPWLVMAACSPSSPDIEASADFSGLTDGWNQIAGPDHTSCAHGTDFAFWFRPASTDRVAIYFQGGGACWMGEICALDRSPSYDPFVDESDTPPATGIFDFSAEENPIRDWSVLFVPYCTGDVHVGNATRTYDVAANDSLPAGTINIRHAGNANARAALDWLYARVDAPTKVLVTGVSAGSIGAAVHAHNVAAHFPEADVIQLGDAAGGYRAPDAVPAVLASWGGESTLEQAIGPSTDSWTFESLYAGDGQRAANLRMAQINYHEDEAQLGFLSMLGRPNVRLVELLDANMGEIEAAATDFASYLLPGTRHGIIRDPLFYEAAVDGVRLRDWAADLIAGEPVPSVRCSRCR